jgi:succinyl-CoA synthetase beta subunit
MLTKHGDAIKVPIIVRLQGTNAAKAIDNSGMPILSAVEFQKRLTKLKQHFLINSYI